MYRQGPGKQEPVREDNRWILREFRIRSQHRVLGTLRKSRMEIRKPKIEGCDPWDLSLAWISSLETGIVSPSFPILTCDLEP